MKRFSEWVSEQTNIGTYAAVRPLDAENLHGIAADAGIPNVEPAAKMHVTLLYSRKPLPAYMPDKDLMHDAEVTDLEIWHTKSGKSALIVKLNAPTLVDRHEKLMNDHEAEYDYDEFKPHLTLSYDVGDFDLSKINKDMFPRRISLGKEYMETLDTGGK